MTSQELRHEQVKPFFTLAKRLFYTGIYTNTIFCIYILMHHKEEPLYLNKLENAINETTTWLILLGAGIYIVTLIAFTYRAVKDDINDLNGGTM